jgi:hypothetical protein
MMNSTKRKYLMQEDSRKRDQEEEWVKGVEKGR